MSLNLLKTVLSPYSISDKKLEIYNEYILLIIEENKKYDLTAIENYENILVLHIEDALKSSSIIYDYNHKIVADIGSGLGIPGIVLAILFPDIQFILIEVLTKRCNFLKKVIDFLKIKNCTVLSEDFKTVIRKQKYKIDLFISRATFDLENLVYIYSGNNKLYLNSEILYWASSEYFPEKKTIEKFKKLQKKIDTINYILYKNIRSRVFFHIKKVTNELA